MIAARLIDRALEATVVGSFSTVGYLTRRRVLGWQEPDQLPGTSVMITGATSGLGFEAAVQLAGLGASVTFIARDLARARRARASIAEHSGRDDVSFLIADMSDFSAIRDAAAAYLEDHDTLDVLIHNAGALSDRYERTPEGREVTVAAHVLGPFLLTGLLLPALQHRPGPDRPARVLTMSSGGMYSQRFDLERLESGPEDFDGVAAYARAKRAQVVLNHEWANRVDPQQVVFHALHPGWADTPGVQHSLPGFYRLTRPVLRTPQQGVDTLVWLCHAPEASQESGLFWLDRTPRSEYKLPWTRPADPITDQKGLWEWCQDATASSAATSDELTQGP